MTAGGVGDAPERGDTEAADLDDLGDVGVVGAGLVGTSIGLALARAGIRALLVDEDPARAAAAAALGAGRAAARDDLTTCRHVVVAVPPSSIAAAVREVQRLSPDLTVSDVGSIKTSVQRDIETLDVDAVRFCGGHPVAGRERGGPGAARADLFDGAVWVLTPSPASGSRAVADAERLARACGARPVTMTPEDHDAALAVVSHLPQVVAGALAARLADAGERGPLLAGPGFRDTTRLADSDPGLWTEILERNAAPVAEAVRAVATDLLGVADALAAGRPAGVRTVLEAGRTARATLPGKGAAARPGWARAGVVVPDRPGELARLLAAAGRAGVNVEDLAIDHVPDRQAGFVELAVAPDRMDTLLAALAADGWSAYDAG